MCVALDSLDSPNPVDSVGSASSWGIVDLRSREAEAAVAITSTSQ